MGPKRAFVLDLDATMVGDVRPVLQRYQLLSALKGMGLRTPCPSRSVEDALRFTPLLRPGLVEFLRRRSREGASLYVFTAADRTWAQEVVRAIQRISGVQFSKPLFARDDCLVRATDGSVRKSLATVAARALLRGPAASRCALHNTTVIDNSDVWEDLGGAKFVHCPSYEYRATVDPLAGVPAATLEDPRARTLLARLCEAGVCYNPLKYGDPAKSACHVHRWLARDADVSVRNNRPHLRDQFFDSMD